MSSSPRQRSRGGKPSDNTSRLQSANQAEHRHRQDLFSKKQQKQKNSTANEAQKIQQSLMKTQHLLKSELNRMSHITTAIDDDEQRLQGAMMQHKSLNTKQAQKQLTALQRAQQHEHRVLTASIVFFGLTVFYVMWSRVLYKFDFVSVILDWMV